MTAMWEEGINSKSGGRKAVRVRLPPPAPVHDTCETPWRGTCRNPGCVPILSGLSYDFGTHPKSGAGKRPQGSLLRTIPRNPSLRGGTQPGRSGRPGRPPTAPASSLPAAGSRGSRGDLRSPLPAGMHLRSPWTINRSSGARIRPAFGKAGKPNRGDRRICVI